MYTYTIVPVLTEEDRKEYSRVLHNANLRMEKKGIHQWKDDLLEPDIVFAGDPPGFMAMHEGKAAAVCYLTETDPLFWRGDEAEPALYVHKLACREEYAGKVQRRPYYGSVWKKPGKRGSAFCALPVGQHSQNCGLCMKKWGFPMPGWPMYRL